MVLLDRIELSTSSLPMTRSTTELQQQPNARAIHRRRVGAAYGGAPPACQGAGVDDSAIWTDGQRMSKTPSPANRERERRLADALRPNLPKRKARKREAKAAGDIGRASGREEEGQTV